MAEFEGIQFEIKGNADAAAQSLLRFANALKKVNEAAAQSSKLRELADALAKIAGVNFSGLSSLTQLSSILSSLSNASRASAALSKLADSLAKFGQTLNGVGKASRILNNFANALTRLSQLGRITIPKNLGERLLDIAMAAEKISPQALQNLDRLTTYLARLSTLSLQGLSQAIRALGALGNQASPKVKTDGLSKVQQMAKKAWGALSKLGKTIVLKIKDATLGKVTKSIGKVRDAFKALGRIAYYRAIRSVIKAITQAFQEGLKNAYLFSKGLSDAVDGRIATALDGLTSNALKMKNQLGAAFGSLLAAIAPAINALIGLVTALATAITQLFAALSGGTFLKAKDVSAEFADNMKAGGGAAKEWKNQLMGFDEINRLEDQNGGGGGGGSSALDPADMFDVENVDSAIKTFVDKLKQAIKGGDWSGVGDLLGNAINGMFSDIDVFMDYGDKVGKIIDGFIQSFYYTLKTVDFNQIGADIATFINSALVRIDSNVWGRLIVRKLTAAIDFVIGLLGNLNWYQIGDKIGGFLRGALDEASEWFTNYDWAEAAQNFSDNLIAFFDGLDSAELADSIITFFSKAFDALTTFVSNIKWDEVLSSVKKGIQGVFDKLPDGTKKVLAVIAGIAALIITFKGIISVISGVSTAFSAFKTVAALLTSPIGKVVLAIAAVVAVVALLIVGFKALKNWWDQSNLKKSFVETWDGIKQAFANGKEELSKDIENIKSFFTGIPEKFEEAKQSLSDKWDELKKKVSEWTAPVVEFVADVKNDSSKWWTNVKTWWKEKADKVSDFITNVKDDSSEWWNNVCTWWDNKKTATLEFAVKVKNDAAKWWKDVQDWWKNTASQLWTTLGIHLPTIEITWRDWFSAFGHTVQAPEFNIKWNAKGGIVDGATLIGAGEAGKEAIIPLERNTEWISKVASELNEQQSKQSNNIDFASAMEDANDGVISAVFAAATQIVNAIADNSGGGEIDYRSLAKQVSKVQRQMARANG